MGVGVGCSRLKDRRMGGNGPRTASLTSPLSWAPLLPFYLIFQESFPFLIFMSLTDTHLAHSPRSVGPHFSLGHMRSRGHGIKPTSILLREMPVRGKGEGAGQGWESRETTMQSRPQRKERQTETERSKGGREGRLAATEQRFKGWQACRTSSH